MIIALILIFFSTYIILKVSRSFDFAASFLTQHLSEGIKGPTVNAIASSLPELLISFFFLFYIGNIQGFAAGFATIIGSSIFNIALIPTISFLYIYLKKGVKEFPTDRTIILQDGMFLIITETALLLALIYGGVSVALSTSLILLYTTYLIWIIISRNKKAKTDHEKKIFLEKFIQKKQILSSINRSLLLKIIHVDLTGLFNIKKSFTKHKAISIILCSIILIAISCQLLVHSSEELSKALGLNLFFITFFITAIASSIPDTILSVKDAENQNYKDSFSNAYGSNIFDICIGIGLPVLIYLLTNNISEIKLDSSNIIILSAILLLIFTSIITFIYWIRNINLYRAILIVGMYLAFLATIYYISLQY